VLIFLNITGLCNYYNYCNVVMTYHTWCGCTQQGQSATVPRPHHCDTSRGRRSLESQPARTAPCGERWTHRQVWPWNQPFV